MKVHAVIGIFLFSTTILSFAQDPSDWGTRSFPQSGSNTGSPSDRPFSGENGRITGTVIAPDGKPQEDVRVQIHDFAGGILASTYTGLSGSFSFDIVPYGRYEVTATRGLASVRQDIEVRDSFSVVNLNFSTSDAKDTPNHKALVSVAELKVPQRARDAYAKAENAMMRNQLEKISKYVQKALEICPTYAPALSLRGALLLDEGDVTAAIDDFDKAIRADSTLAVAHTGMAAALNRLNKFDDALRSAERASTLAPNSWQPYFEMAKSYLGKTDYQRALEEFTHAQRQMTQDYAPMHLLRASVFLALKHYSDAAAELKVFLKMVPKDDPRASGAKQALTRINAFESKATLGETEQSH